MTHNEDDTVITVRMSRKDYKILREIVERERAYSWIKNYIRSFWVWALAGGLLAVLALNDKISTMLR